MKKLLLYTLFLLNTLALCAQADTLQLYLVRHAPVDMQKPLFIGSGKAAELMAEYNFCPIVAFDGEELRKQLPANAPVIYSSTMLRAIETARTVYPSDSIHAKPMFSEYQMGMVEIPLLHMPYSGWTGLSRFFWQLHLNNSAETRHHATKRMKKAARRLELYAEENGAVVLFAHGFLIRELRHELQKRGWKLEENGGNKNLAVLHLSKIVRP